ncbi:hypothetical protein [Lysobacter antibioticus]|jgi:hypothetical protein|uniref:Uncharacterized protein n=1 Tax=Lysobacter antibioticus TaxID=84531 RepID=A0A0S2F5T2_LYSAN|nr:hypothetical protein [Lysobacter antibioticus]ALN78864.1 hypothetical protein LA76x_0703 [Lysobacter antibioticus]
MTFETRPDRGPEPSRAMQALYDATWFALCEGDRYSAMGRRAVANSFYKLLPLLAEARKAMALETAAVQAAGDGAATAGERALCMLPLAGIGTIDAVSSSLAQDE